MRLQKLIHRLRNENSKMGEVTREIEKDNHYFSFKDEKLLKDYLKEKMLRKGMLSGFAELLATQEIINFNTEYTHS